MEQCERKRELRKARRLLRNPDPAHIMRELFALRGFDVIEAVDKQIEHIRSGSLRALEGYFAGAIPQPAKRLKIQQQTAIAHVRVEPARVAIGPPPMAPRKLGPAIVEQINE